MAEGQQFEFEEEFTCPVCLEILSDPVSIPCGHNFCLTCLTSYWDVSRVCSCPQCRRTFAPRPELCRNTVLKEAIKKLKRPGFGSPRSRNYGSSTDVTCDACTGKKFRAVKSCLTCMASFCQRHLQPHFEGDALKHHKLVDSDRNLKEKLCAKHQRSLEIFCKTDETCICTMCVVTKHSGHKMVKLETERGQKQKELGATLSEIRKRLQEKKKTLKEIRRAVKQMKISVDKEVEENEKNFVDLIHCIEEAHRKLTERIREHEKREMEKAEEVMEQLQTEIEELKRRDAELKELSETKDHVQFLQNFSSLCVLPTDEDSLITTVTTDFSSEDLRKELSGLKKSLEKIGQWDIMSLSLSGHEASVFILQPPEPQSREEFLQYSCALTLNINTAHRELRLSEGDKKVTREKTDAGYPDHPDRFDWYSQVLCREALTGTRSYWEVECAGDYVKIGVASKEMRRKGDGDECGLGNNDQSWTLQWSHSKYFVYYNNKGTVINAPYSPRIGVYLDNTAGTLSFYNVAHKITLLYRFNACFTEPLYPGFWLDCDSSVTICCLTQCDR